MNSAIHEKFSLTSNSELSGYVPFVLQPQVFVTSIIHIICPCQKGCSLVTLLAQPILTYSYQTFPFHFSYVNGSSLRLLGLLF